jgi:hypothetical protein
MDKIFLVYFSYFALTLTQTCSMKISVKGYFAEVGIKIMTYIHEYI